MRACILVLLTLGLCAAETSKDGTKVWTSAELKALGQKMAAKKEKVGTETLTVLNNYQMSVSYRNASGEAELHHTKNDIFYILSGGCTLLTGGTVANPRNTQPNEVRGSAVTGGQKHKLGPGDFLTIPAGVPHQMILEPGSEITYAVVKVNTK